MAGKKTEVPEKACQQCGNPVLPRWKANGHRWQPAKYCSQACASMAMKRPKPDFPERACIMCQKSIEPYVTTSGQWYQPQKYCSKRCADNAKRKWEGETTTCEVCGKVQPFPRPLKSGAFSYVRHKTCSLRCSRIAAHNAGNFPNTRPATPPTLTCPQCGKIVPRPYNKSNQSYNYKQKFCSRDCANAAQFKGGSVHSRDGYIHVAGRHAHRLVMEQAIGRKLTPSETVHHKNLIRSDNRPENLELWASRHPRGMRVSDQADPNEDIWNGMTPRWAIDCIV